MRCLFDITPTEHDEFVDGELWYGMEIERVAHWADFNCRFGRGSFMDSQEFTKRAGGNTLSLLNAFTRLIGLDSPAQLLPFRDRYSLLLSSSNLNRCPFVISIVILF